MNTTKLKQLSSLALESFNHLLWPNVCINCRQHISKSNQCLCQNCWNELLTSACGDYCPRCGRDASKYAILNGTCPDCQGKQFFFDQISRAGIYNRTLREMVLAFKFSGRTELKTALGFLLNSALETMSLTNEIDFFVPVPLHFSRRLTRGYNQAHLLAKSLKHPAKINTDLVRMRRTRSQPTMATPASRAANVAGAFAVRRGHKFKDRNICLVDDIKTSGATANECAKTLKQAGAEKVMVLVIGVAAQHIA